MDWLCVAVVISLRDLASGSTLFHLIQVFNYLFIYGVDLFAIFS